MAYSTKLITSRNKEIKLLMYDSGIAQWRVAEALGISTATFARLLQKRLSDEEKQEIMDAIERAGKGLADE